LAFPIDIDRRPYNTLALPCDGASVWCRKILGNFSDGKSMKSCVIHRTEKKFGSFSNCRYCADRAQNLLGPAPTFGLQYSKFHSNRFTFGGVIAERVKAVFFAHKVNPWFVSNTLEANNYVIVKPWQLNVVVGCTNCHTCNTFHSIYRPKVYMRHIRNNVTN